MRILLFFYTTSISLTIKFSVYDIRSCSNRSIGQAIILIYKLYFTDDKDYFNKFTQRII